MRARIAVGVAVLLALAAGAALAQAPAPRAQYRLEGGRPHADVPFHLDLIVEGFDEAPAPEHPKLEIPGAAVTPLGVTPNVSRSIQIVNGRRHDSTTVTWVLRYRVVVAKEGTLRVPPLTITQGAKSATVAAGETRVDTVPAAADMKLALELPARAVFVGETVPVKLVWLFRRQPQDPSFTVPLLGLDAFAVSTPPVGNARKAITIAAGAKDLQLPYELDQIAVGGVEHNRLTATFNIAPREVPPGGKVEVPAAAVVAGIPVGRADFFGNAPTQLFRALDVARTLEVKPLPETDRPPAFAGAVGEHFAIDVRTSRSVVQLGEPVQLDITVKSDQRLDTLALGKLDAPGRLPKDKFTVSGDPPMGELSDEGKTKTFRVIAQVTGPATEVPAIAFSYFDPTRNTYQTIHSEPIALSVKGSSVVGAGDVVAATPAKRATAAAAADDAAVAVKADLALSSLGDVDRRPLHGTALWLLVGCLYALPLAFLLLRTWQVRTAARREEAGEVRAARRRVEELLDRAGGAPARELAGPLGAALRELARVLEPRARRRRPVRAARDRGVRAGDVRAAAVGRAALRRRRPAAPVDPRGAARARRRVKHAAAALAVLALGLPGAARADTLLDGRQLYEEAIATRDATAKRAAFGRAAVAFADAVRADPDRPELLADWGKAALGAGGGATAPLACRRARAFDPSNARAKENLGWLRGHVGDAFRPVDDAGATATLLFFHDWPRAHRLLVGACAFALAVLLLVPWRGRRDVILSRLAVLPVAIWLAMLVSLVVEDRRTDDAVVMDGVVLRAADSAGAPAAMSQPLPRGAEVTILERRAAWTRVRIANGTAGWIPGGAVEPVR